MTVSKRVHAGEFPGQQSWSVSCCTFPSRQDTPYHARFTQQLREIL